MDSQTFPSIPDKQPGKCPIVAKVQKGETNNKMIIAIPGEGTPSLEQYYALMQKLTATNDTELAKEICNRAIGAMPANFGDEHNSNAVYQSLSDFEPRDSIESKLCLQSTSLYAQGMRYLAKAEKSELASHLEMYMGFAIKLLRLHNETIEALNRHRRNGEQKVIVQHVNVESGGKAIVSGNMSAGRGNA